MLQKEVPMQINVLASQVAKQQGLLVVADCGGRDDEMPADLLHNVTVLSPNSSELERLVGAWQDEQEMY